MTTFSLGGNVVWPAHVAFVTNPGTGKTMDAATEKAALIGQVNIQGGVATSKVLSSAGGIIGWRSGVSTFVNSGTSIDIGIQNVDGAVTSAQARPDGAYTVKATWVGATNSVGSNTWNVTPMATGSHTIAHGDLVCVVLDMVGRAGADSVIWSTSDTVPTPARPSTNIFLAGAWSSTGQNDLPHAYMIFDDGTYGTIFCRQNFVAAVDGTQAFNSVAAADEYGTLFQTPVNCTLSGVFAHAGGITSAADLRVLVYSSPFSTTPTSVYSTNINAEQAGVAIAGSLNVLLPTPVSLVASTDYTVTVHATNTANITMDLISLPDENLRNFMTGGESIKGVSRANLTGSFTSSETTMYSIGVLLSEIEVATGGGGGLKLVGTGGLAG